MYVSHLCNVAAEIVLTQPQNIFENSTMMRQLCVQLSSPIILERVVPVFIMFQDIPGSYARVGKFKLIVAFSLYIMHAHILNTNYNMSLNFIPLLTLSIYCMFFLCLFR